MGGGGARLHAPRAQIQGQGVHGPALARPIRSAMPVSPPPATAAPPAARLAHVCAGLSDHPGCGVACSASAQVANRPHRVASDQLQHQRVGIQMLGTACGRRTGYPSLAEPSLPNRHAHSPHPARPEATRRQTHPQTADAPQSNARRHATAFPLVWTALLSCFGGAVLDEAIARTPSGRPIIARECSSRRPPEKQRPRTI